MLVSMSEPAISRITMNWTLRSAVLKNCSKRHRCEAALAPDGMPRNTAAHASAIDTRRFAMGSPSREDGSTCGDDRAYHGEARDWVATRGCRRNPSGVTRVLCLVACAIGAALGCGDEERTAP